ncbi:MAG: hypothetical protein R2729_31750 [Bryobacteraceae bacterium]
MLRFTIILLGAIILITLLRGSIGLFAKAFRELLNPSPNTPAPIRRDGLVQCPMCGSWVEPPVPPKDQS